MNSAQGQNAGKCIFKQLRKWFLYKHVKINLNTKLDEIIPLVSLRSTSFNKNQNTLCTCALQSWVLIIWARLKTKDSPRFTPCKSAPTKKINISRKTKAWGLYPTNQENTTIRNWNIARNLSEKPPAQLLSHQAKPDVATIDNAIKITNATK